MTENQIAAKEAKATAKTAKGNTIPKESAQPENNASNPIIGEAATMGTEAPKEESKAVALRPIEEVTKKYEESGVKAFVSNLTISLCGVTSQTEEQADKLLALFLHNAFNKSCYGVGEKLNGEPIGGKTLLINGQKVRALRLDERGGTGEKNRRIFTESPTDYKNRQKEVGLVWLANVAGDSVAERVASFI